MKRRGYFIIIACIFLWIGFVGAISFMEAWLKFRAPGVTLSLGLGIGKIVFGALNKVEWLLAFIILAFAYTSGVLAAKRQSLWVLAAVLVLLLQTVWLLPALDLRADAFIGGSAPGPSTLHWYFVAGELIKVASLFTAGTRMFGLLNV